MTSQNIHIFTKEISENEKLKGLDQKGLLTKIVQVGKIDFSTNKYLIFSTQNST